MSRALAVIALVLAAPVAALIACSTGASDGPQVLVLDSGPDTSSTIPEVCSTVGDPHSCATGLHLERRSGAAQEDCKKGIADRRCGEARFYLELCLDTSPLCFDDAGVPTNDDAARCADQRARWLACEGAAPP